MRVSARIDHQAVPADSAVLTVEAHEGLSVLFDVRVVFASSDPDLDLASMLWSSACLTFTADAAPRSFHGVIEAARYVGSVSDRHHYELRLRPALHGLAYRVRTRIFQEKNAVDILKQVFADAGLPSDGVRWQLSGEYPVRTYTCQWKESELAFALRLLEDEGIFFWFEHSDVDHVLCFGDAPSVHTPIEGDPVLHFGAPGGDFAAETLWSPRLTRALAHDGYRSRDWNFETPELPLQSDDGEDTVRLRYEYPGGYADAAQGGRLARVRIEQLWRDRDVLSAEADCVRLTPGGKFSLTGAFPDLLNREYLVTACEHRFENEDRVTSSRGDYVNRVRGIPVERPFRPARVTARPKVWGLESAVVTGPGGEEIHVDQWGRIKVHFYWDRENPVDDTASCYVRFQQLNTSGAMVLPRVGWEVSIGFLDGDPDRPVAFHKAYNQETLPPYGLPANKTQSALQSSTYPGGGSTNEIRMQDGNGGMEWFLHSSRDLSVSVGNDEAVTVGVDAESTIGAVYSMQVGGDESGSVGANQSVSVTTNATAHTVGNKTVDVSGNDDWGLTKNFTFTTGGDRTEDISGLMNVLANKVSETFNSDHQRDVGAVQSIVSATAIAETVGGPKEEHVSAAKAIVTPRSHAESFKGRKALLSGAITLKSGKDVSHTAKGAFALTSAAVIDIKAKDACTINGSQVRVTCASAKFKGGGGTFEMGASIKIDAKKFGGKGGPMLKLKGNLDYK